MNLPVDRPLRRLQSNGASVAPGYVGAVSNPASAWQAAPWLSAFGWRRLC